MDKPIVHIKIKSIKSGEDISKIDEPIYTYSFIER